jgi:ATP-dependent DNA helicase RecG
VDYREKLDLQVRWTDRVYPDGTWEANLFQFYQRVWPKLAMGLPVPFRLEGGIRRDETPAHVALREAFVNALIHADYSAQGGIVLERYLDRFVFDNPGNLLVSFEQFRQGGISACRNKSLQRMFLMIGGGEQAGSGVDKIRTGWRSNHWRPPLIERTLKPERFRIVMPMSSLIPDQTLNRLKVLFGSELDGLQPDELQALATADLEDGVSNGRLQDFVARHSVDISRMLQSLCERGFLVSDNRRRWATYRLSKKSVDSPSLFDSPVWESGPLAGESGPLGREDLPKTPKKPDLVELVAKKGKATPAEVEGAILILCAKEFRTNEQIAKRLNRDPDRIRKLFLAPMVKNGVLRLKFPGTPNRPGQAYVTANLPT